MISHSGITESCWKIPHAFPARANLDHTVETNVCIIGGGIVGITTAYLLSREGVDTVLLEQGRLLGGDTARTTAHLSPIMDDGLAQIEKWHGAEASKLVFASHAEAIDLIEKIVEEEKIDCDFRRLDGYLFEDKVQNKKSRDLDDELQVANRLGIPAKSRPLPLKGISNKAAIQFPNQAQFHVSKYLRALVKIVLAKGGKIFEDTRVNDVEWGDPERDAWSIVKTESRHHVKAKAVVEAANSLVTGSFRTITKLYPYRTYAIAAQIPKGSIPSVLLWDTNEPYHYVRTTPGEENGPDLIIVGGEDHKTGQKDDADERYKNLEAWARDRFPSMQGVTHRWSGQVLETPDGLALIGRNPGNPENSYLISGDSGHGITHGTLGAMIVTDQILTRANPFAKIYSPDRLHASSLNEWVQENANVGLQYLDWVKNKQSTQVDSIPCGEGGLIRDGVSWIAAYKDHEGKVFACSAVCPHLGGIVQWNRGEKTWDCPCHGSRFNTRGEAIASPTVKSLPHKRAPATKA